MNTYLAIEDAPSPGHGSKLTDGMIGDPYITTLTAIGGKGDYLWTIVPPPAMVSIHGVTPQSGEIFQVPDYL
jgi:hypothetical protein